MPNSRLSWNSSPVPPRASFGPRVELGSREFGARKQTRAFPAPPLKRPDVRPHRDCDCRSLSRPPVRAASRARARGGVTQRRSTKAPTDRSGGYPVATADVQSTWSCLASWAGTIPAALSGYCIRSAAIASIFVRPRADPGHCDGDHCCYCCVLSLSANFSAFFSASLAALRSPLVPRPSLPAAGSPPASSAATPSDDAGAVGPGLVGLGFPA